MADVFVFGSNLAGRHGKGAALHALENHGAIYGKGQGRQGDSYAIPTKISPWIPMPLGDIRYYISRFLLYAKAHPQDTFNVTAIGCGLAGYSPEQIAPMFRHITDNVKLPEEFLEVLNKTTKQQE